MHESLPKDTSVAFSRSTVSRRKQAKIRPKVKSWRSDTNESQKHLCINVSFTSDFSIFIVSVLLNLAWVQIKKAMILFLKGLESEGLEIWWSSVRLFSSLMLNMSENTISVWKTSKRQRRSVVALESWSNDLRQVLCGDYSSFRHHTNRLSWKRCNTLVFLSAA